MRFLEFSGKWDVVLNNDDVEIIISKFVKLLDDSTIKKLREHEKNSGINPERFRTKDKDKEEDEDKDTEGMEVVFLPCSKTTSCQEPIIEIPLKEGYGTYKVTQADVNSWKASFPEIDLLQELQVIRLWNKDHPGRRKTRKNIKRHVSLWLKKEQDKITTDQTHNEVGGVWDSPL